jgi:hypothetical protein
MNIKQFSSSITIWVHLVGFAELEAMYNLEKRDGSG